MKKLYILILLIFIIFSCELNPFRNRNKDNIVISSQDREAQFPGGMEPMKQFIIDNIAYPEQAIEKDVEGKVMVEFTVEKNGRISNITPLTGHKLLKREAFKIVQKMPPWIPALEKNKPVRTKCRLPINFQLN